MLIDQKMSVAASQRVDALLLGHHCRLRARIDFLFGVLLLIQSLGTTALAINLARLPTVSAPDSVVAAVGAVVASSVAMLGIIVVLFCRGRTLTSHIAALGQLTIAALLIVLSHGSPLAYLHLLASLTLLALYRNQGLLITSTVATMALFLFLRIRFPAYAFGLFFGGEAHWLELALSVVAANGLLALACHISHRELAMLLRARSMYELAAEMLPSARGQLEQSEERFRSLSVSSPVGIFQTDAANHCVYTNQRWTDLTKLSAEDSLGGGWLNAIHPQDRPAFLNQWSTAAAQGREVNAEFRVHAPTASPEQARWVRSRANPIRHDNVITGYVGILEDTTEQIQAQLQMRLAKESAEAASRAKSEFLANMSHEIRTPMTAIVGYADLMLTRTLPAEEQSKCVRNIRQNGYHLLTVINDILDLSKIEAGRMSIERIPCSPHQMLCDVVAMMRGRAMERGLSFGLEYRSSIPQSIQTDPTRLRQIIMNLVGNAIKFTDKGSVRLAVSLQTDAKSRGSFLRVDVIDTGIGLSVEQRVKLLMPFAQADTSTTRKYGGTGLGLVISMRLAEMLGGGISIKSALGQGSTFTLLTETGSLAQIPLVDDPQQVETHAPTSGYVEPVSLSGNVLVAEDGFDNQQLLLFYLQEAGLEVELVTNGKLALERVTARAAENRPYDAVLMDMQMPEMDGYSAARAIRKIGYTGKMVALTAHAMHGDRQKCLDAGCDDYLTKPIAWDELFKLLGTCVRPGVARLPHMAAAPASTFAIKDAGKVQKLVQNFLTRLPQRMSDIQSAIASNDLEKLKVHIHQLKGASTGYGFPKISEAARQLEDLVKASESIDALRAQAMLIDDLCRQIIVPTTVNA